MSEQKIIAVVGAAALTFSSRTANDQVLMQLVSMSVLQERLGIA